MTATLSPSPIQVPLDPPPHEFATAIADVRINRIHSEMPTHVGAHFVYRPPRWYLNLVRTLAAAAGITAALAAIHSWDAMPLPFRSLACVLVPVFFYFATTRKIADPKIQFLADERGMFFPASGRWLFIPWANVSDIRVAKMMNGEDSTGVAFNLALSPHEQREFFPNYLMPHDHLKSRGGPLAVGYVSYPPLPKALKAILSDLKHKGQQGSHNHATLVNVRES